MPSHFFRIIHQIQGTAGDCSATESSSCPGYGLEVDPLAKDVDMAMRDRGKQNNKAMSIQKKRSLHEVRKLDEE